MMGGGLYNMSLHGTGWVAILSDGPPVLLNVAAAPTFADAQAAITWSSGVTTGIRTDFKMKNLIGRGSGETVQMSFSGQGWVLVQPSEGQVAGGAAGPAAERRWPRLAAEPVIGFVGLGNIGQPMARALAARAATSVVVHDRDGRAAEPCVAEGAHGRAGRTSPAARSSRSPCPTTRRSRRCSATARDLGGRARGRPQHDPARHRAAAGRRAGRRCSTRRCPAAPTARSRAI